MANTQQRMIITGGSGFIGSFLIEKLLKEGYGNITNISAETSHSNSLITQKIGDIGDRSLLEETIKTGDIVVHMAESVIPSTSELNRKEDVTKNLGGLLTLLDVCVEKKIKKIVYLSSGGAVYGPSEDSLKETDPTNPCNSYGVLKLAAEKYLGVYKYLYNLSNIIIRPSNPFGRTRMTANHSAVDTFLQKILKNETIAIWGDGSITRDYIHIEDLVNFLFRAVTDDTYEGVYNVGTGVPTSLRDLVQIIEKVTGKTARVEYQKERSQDVKRNVLDIAKAQKTGWKPTFSLEEGIKNIYTKIQQS